MDEPLRDDLRVLEALLRQSERAVDHELVGAADVDKKIEILVTAASAALGWGFSLGAFILAGIPTAGPVAASTSIVLLVAAIVLNGLALASFAAGYIGPESGRVLQPAPDPAWLGRAANEVVAPPESGRWDAREYYRCLVESYGAFYESNLAPIRKAIRLRARGVWLLLGAVGTYAALSLATALLRTAAG